MLTPVDRRPAFLFRPALVGVRVGVGGELRQVAGYLFFFAEYALARVGSFLGGGGMGRLN